jgi:hypothetical protein
MIDGMLLLGNSTMNCVESFFESLKEATDHQIGKLFSIMQGIKSLGE